MIQPRIRKELARYLLAGSLAFACDIATLYFLTDILGIHYLASNIVSFSVGLGVAYVSNAFWVFDYRRYRQVSREFAIFAVIALCGIVINELLLYLLVELLLAHYLLAKIVAAAAVFLFNFLARRYLLFSERQSDTNGSTDVT